MPDASFIGYCVTEGTDCGAKVVATDLQKEDGGVIFMTNGILWNGYEVFRIFQNFFENGSKRNPGGWVTFSAGSICGILLSTDFLKTITSDLENEMMHHIAEKKIPYVNTEREIIHPRRVNGIKLEKCVFDVFQFSNDFVIWEIPLDEESSPLKNAE